MKKDYKFSVVEYAGQMVGVFESTIGSIPADEGNRHYQEYLEWLAEGNEPELVEGDA